MIVLKALLFRLNGSMRQSLKGFRSSSEKCRGITTAMLAGTQQLHSLFWQVTFRKHRPGGDNPSGYTAETSRNGTILPQQPVL